MCVEKSIQINQEEHQLQLQKNSNLGVRLTHLIQYFNNIPLISYQQTTVKNRNYLNKTLQPLSCMKIRHKKLRGFKNMDRLLRC